MQLLYINNMKIYFSKCELTSSMINSTYIVIFKSLLLMQFNALHTYSIKYNISYLENNLGINSLENHLIFMADSDNTAVLTFCYSTMKRQFRSYFRIKHMSSYYITIKYPANGSLFDNIFNHNTANFLKNVICNPVEGKPNSNICPVKYQIHHIYML